MHSGKVGESTLIRFFFAETLQNIPIYVALTLKSGYIYASISYTFVDLDEIFVKIDYAKWTDWDENEIKAIKDYVLMDWIEFANNEKSEIGKTELESYSKFFEIKELMQLWYICNSENALRNFALFFYYYGNQILNGGLTLNNHKYEDELISLIHTKNLPARIDEEFYKHELIDQDYAQKVSIVLQIIEQEIKTKPPVIGSNK